MTDDREHPDAGPGDGHDPFHEAHLGEFTEELRLLAEAVLERVEPVLRRAAADGRTEWGGCSWCPVCAAAALARGEHHDVVAALAGHGTAIVTVLREALAGVPVEPVMPDDSDGDDGRSPADPDDCSGSGPPGRESGPRAGESRSSRPRYVAIPVQINH